MKMIRPWITNPNRNSKEKWFQHSETKEEFIEELMYEYCFNYCEDPINGSAWDLHVLKTLEKLKDEAHDYV